MKNQDKEIQEQMSNLTEEQKFDEETQRLQDELMEEMRQEEEKESETNTDGDNEQRTDDRNEDRDETGTEDKTIDDKDESQSKEKTDKSDDDKELVDEDKENKSDKDDTEDKDDKTDIENKDDKVDFEPMTVKVNGYDIEIKSQEELMAFVQKGADTFNQKPESHTQEKAIIDQGKLSNEDLTLMIDAKNGDMNAIAKIAEMAGIDPFDVEKKMSEEYKPTFEATQPGEIDKAANEIVADTALLETYQRVRDNVPDDFMSKIEGDATLLRNFGRHLKSGFAQEVIPQAIAEQIKNGGNFFDAYSRVGQAMANAKADTETKTTEKKEIKQERVMTDREKGMREKIADQKEENHTPGSEDTAKAIWQLSDEEFDEKYGR